MPPFTGLTAALTRFQTALAQPKRTQQAVLADILHRNRDCAFGREHRFAELKNYGDFARALPVRRYEDFSPSIGQIAAGRSGILTAEAISNFEETGGSSGGAKLIPYTDGLYAAFRRAVLPWLADLQRQRPQALAGRLFFVISPLTRSRDKTEGGIPIGSGNDLDYFGRETGAALAEKTLFLPELLAAQTAEEWQFHCARLLLSAENLSFISVWSPSILLPILQTMQELQDRLLAEIHEPRRRAVLSRALSATQPDTRLIWPQLDTVSCWDSHTAAAPAALLRQKLPHVWIQGKGLLSTEAVSSIPFSDGLHPILAVDSHFYEFADERDIYPAWALQNGCDYRLIITTQGGLYRYDTGDRVCIRSMENGIPRLEFVGRDSLTSDLCGEKLTEAFVRRAMLRTAPGLPDHALLQGVNAAPPYYRLILSDGHPASDTGLAAALDNALGENPQYAYARRIGQLAPPQCARTADLQQYAAALFRADQRLALRKTPLLLPPADA